MSIFWCTSIFSARIIYCTFGYVPLAESFSLIKPSDVLSDGTRYITTRVHHQGSHTVTGREDDYLRRRVTTQRETCNTWQSYLSNVREVL